MHFILSFLSLRLLSPHLRGPSVFPACSDMSDDAGVALFAHIDTVHLDDALARVETGDGCHSAWRETETSKDKKERRQGQYSNYFTSSCRWKRNPDETNNGTSQKTTVTSSTSCTQNWVEQHSFFVFVFATLVSCFGSSGGVCERGGKLFIWGRRGPLWGMWFRP